MSAAKQFKPCTLTTLVFQLLLCPLLLLPLLLLLHGTLSAAGTWSPVEGYCEPYTNPDGSNGYSNIPNPACDDYTALDVS
jgi:hypothetical protein